MRSDDVGDERKRHPDHAAFIEHLVNTFGVHRDHAVAAVDAVDRFVKRAQRRDRGSGGLIHRKVLWNDLRQECFLIVLATLQRFDPSRGASVATYLWSHFRKSVGKVLRLWNDENEWLDSEPISDREMPEDAQPRSLGHAFAALPNWFTADGGWQTFTSALAGVPRKATVFDWCNLRASLLQLNSDAPVDVPQQTYARITPHEHGVFRRSRFWHALSDSSR